MISISIVSHGQFYLVQYLLDDLEKYCKDNIEVLLTINVPEKLPENFSNYSFPIRLIINTRPKGFGENHNNAFRQATQPYFCVLNPDIRLDKNKPDENIFLSLVKKLNELDEDKENKENVQKNKEKHKIKYKTGVIAPMIVDENGKLQDSARKFLTLTELVKRVFCKIIPESNINYPDWVAGMFMLFRKEVYAEIKGFDESYYLYCEDMDLCARLRRKNYEIYYDNTVKIIHSAQRQSHKKIRYLVWHIRSLLRYFYRHYSRFVPHSRK